MFPFWIDFQASSLLQFLPVLLAGIGLFLSQLLGRGY